MGRIRRDDKYIGSAILNDLEVGDEICVHLEDGTYRNKEVTAVNDIFSTEYDDGKKKEVTLGDVTSPAHIILGAEAYNGGRGGEDWDVYAYKLSDNPDTPMETLADPDTLYVVNQEINMPDITYDEAVESGYIENTRSMGELKADMETIITVAQDVRKYVRMVKRGELTLAEYEQRLDMLETRHGGQLPFL